MSSNNEPGGAWDQQREIKRLSPTGSPEPVPGLDVERLARALLRFERSWPIEQLERGRKYAIVEVPEATFADAIAAEYAALSPTEAE